jgi:DNA mismatch endonuclease, patch repair protein
VPPRAFPEVSPCGPSAISRQRSHPRMSGKWPSRRNSSVKKMPDVHTPAQRSFNMSRIRGTDTTPERMIQSLLRAEGVRFRANEKTMPGTPDVVLPAFRIAIFVHGCFWHRHRNCRFTTNPKSNLQFWNSKFARTIERDRENFRALKKLGWRVIITWECSIREKPAAVRYKLRLAMKTAKLQQSFRSHPKG